MLGGDLNLPNGGLEARFPGLYIPILNWSFNGPEPTDTQFDTVVVTRQYDGVADFPLYPLNVISLLNAVLGFFYVHLNGFDVSLPTDPRKTSPAYQGKYGDTDYYFFETEDLPLFGPLRTLGVPESLIDVVEPFFREIVELGYDRTISPWDPTPARLIPRPNPVTVAGDLVNALGEGITNAAAIIGAPAPLSRPAGAAETTTADVSDQTATRQQVTQTDQTVTEQQATQTDQTTTAAGHPNRPDHNDDRFDIQAVEACRSARDAAPGGARSARGVRPKDPRTAAFGRCRRADHADRGCRRCGHDRGNLVARSVFGRKFPRRHFAWRPHRRFLRGVHASLAFRMTA